mgnify:FL=1
MIAGTSMGAIIGAMYASGMAGLEIRAFAIDLLSSRLNTLRRLFPGNPGNWTSVFAMGNSAALDPEVLMSAILPDTVPDDFSGLRTPMRIVTADFYREEEFVIDDGPLKKAIGASAALPVLLSPVRWRDRVLIDGGFVNPTPFDILSDQPGFVIAVDVTDAPCARGDFVELIGPNVPLEDVARRCHTIGYEILTGLSRRAERRHAPL